MLLLDFLFTIYFFKSSPLDKVKSFLILLALLHPNIFLLEIPVKPKISFPSFTTERFNTPISGETIHPLIDFLRLSPFFIEYPLQPITPLVNNNLTLRFVKIPGFMGKPCLSCPPFIFTI
mmetsp:Transcript_36914/g.77096  ORF Transcript_36914/g.77096 Transcript_36914/m.77096 type:complete len:120 (+) Transcript_36914:387-746(+)